MTKYSFVNTGFSLILQCFDYQGIVKATRKND